MNEERVRAVVEKVKALQRLTKLTGMSTKRSQGELLAPLSPDELVIASNLLTQESEN